MNILLAEWSQLSKFISDVQLFLAHSDEQIIRFQIISLFLTMIVCAIIACTMWIIRPRYSLDWGLMIREIAFTAVLARSFGALYFRNPPQVWGVIIYGILFLSCIWIVIALVRERRMSLSEVEAKHKEEEDRMPRDFAEGIISDIEDW